MDKIQDAIAKARATRQSPGPAVVSAAVAPKAAPVAPVPPHMPAASWDAIPSFEPAEAKLRNSRIVSAVDGGKGSTDFDVLRTRILQQARANNWRRIAVTSPTPGCGKSTMVLNLGFSLARQHDQRTILADVDMRRPSLAKKLGITDKLRFSRVLAGQEPFEDHARRLDTNLLISTNSQPTRGAAELLQSDVAARALDDISERYDPTIMLFDTPPLLAGDDTMAFLSKVDAVILLAAAEHSSIKQIDACERDIASQTNVMGIVLNKCRYMDRDSSYGYYD